MTSRDDGSFRGFGFIQFASAALAKKAVEMDAPSKDGSWCRVKLNDPAGKGGKGKGKGKVSIRLSLLRERTFQFVGFFFAGGPGRPAFQLVKA